jgi:two-component system nitrate/nitrite response regulator NarL
MRALVVDDDDFTRFLLVRTLQTLDFDAVDDASTAAAGVKLAEAGSPALAVLDLDLGSGPNGIDVAHALRKRLPAIALLMLSSYQDPRLMGAYRELPIGTIYLSKRSVSNEEFLAGAIRTALEAPCAERHRVDGLRTRTGGRSLSDNQVEVMRLVAEGCSNAEIARRRTLTEPAVAKAVARLAKQLDLHAGPAENLRVLIAQAYFDLVGQATVRRP